MAGYENMGIVIEIGAGVSFPPQEGRLGDNVIQHLPMAAGGAARKAEQNSVLIGFTGGDYGYVGMYAGGQAQYIRVSYADFNCLTFPSGEEHVAEFIILAEIFSTGWHGVVISGFQAGESISVFGAEPVGLMAAYSAILRGAARVSVVDSVKERLAAAEEIGYYGDGIKITRPTGGIGVPGLFVAQGMPVISLGKLFEKVISTD
ncbi:S-(hydroxymethyl)glutathione dehydrogenase [Drepanopeziza brunnea f. sp. 'multigermtubi' MB_m1]|uniref:S-(Hydroxymethyl)glutathione dehydrogenase n=1 Tax=Marssonina brunnea f. sp. multigermtubi (strain MB_m1) TaxID=1072389 RepID=K1Y0T4_MARBU|nr:S-(hydroxymethyl)glutathione dehydrogenase [Drepanopeziza brunnea f. sp. 'multigermtubi' MB_m1]EKD18729.1 S-(hydroxymethyl)glutathione dehydrogenase [Drepanopeziza brunnea f. sp. 'multigermtubi' MB_m1]